ncbi:MAG: DUF669 domain-containing protein [Bryobacteraceae bacterium]
MNSQFSDTEPDIDLSIYDEEYAQASTPFSPQDAPADEIPDGLYEAEIEGVHLARTATTGNPMILWRLRIRGPQCEGRAVTKVRVITSKTLGYLKRDLERLDMRLERLSELPARADEMVDRNVRIYKRTNAQRRWTEIYFLGLVGSAESGDLSSDQRSWSTGTDDDLPF